MKIYTKTGDEGLTSLFGGHRVSKADLRLQAYGTTDELNSFVGLLSDQPEMQPEIDFLRNIQSDIFTIGSHLATEDESFRKHLPILSYEPIFELETAIDQMDALLPPLRNFVLPGGHQAVSLCHVCRTVCRRAERYCVELGQADPLIIQYLNRLSDYFFVLSRFVAQRLGIEQTIWKNSHESNKQ